MVKSDPPDLDTPLSEVLKNEFEETTCRTPGPIESPADPRLSRPPIRTPDMLLDSPGFVAPIHSTEPRSIPPQAANDVSEKGNHEKSKHNPKDHQVVTDLVNIVIGRVKIRV